MKKTIYLSVSLLLTLFLCQDLLAQRQRTFSDKKKTGSAVVKAAPMNAKVIRCNHAAHNYMGSNYFAKYKSLQGSVNQRVQATTTPSGFIQVKARDVNGLPLFIEGSSKETIPNLSTPEAIEQAAFGYLNELKSQIFIQNPAQEFEVTSLIEDDLGFKHVRMKQMYQGIPVYASDITVHFTNGGEHLFNGRYHATPSQVVTTASITELDAISRTIASVQNHTNYKELTEKQKEMLGYAGHSGELVIYTIPGYVRDMRLAYHVSLRANFMERWEFFVDARTGDILHSYDHTCSVGRDTGSGTDLNAQTRSFGVFEDAMGTFYMLDGSKSMYTGGDNMLPPLGAGFILTGDMQGTSPSKPSFKEVTSSSKTIWSNSAVSAHSNAIVAFDYFSGTHSRNSINGKGGDVISFINVAEDNGSGMDNAFWNGSAIFYGNGDVAFKPLAGALDVAGHEMSHGVIQETANLEYQGESGALNESFADIFGVMMDRNDWKLGEDVVKGNFFPSGALRDMSDPHNGGTSLSDNGYQPDKYSERFTGSQDNGGVHINSGIVNRAFYLFATDAAVGKDKAELVYYRALAMYLNRSSNFLDCRLAVVQAATDLYGNAVVNAAKSAFDTVEILNPNGQSGPPVPVLVDIPVNQGQEFIVSTDVNVNDANTLYLSSTAGANFQPLSTTAHISKISIVDDGSYGIFTGADHDIRGINIDPTNMGEFNVTTDQFWDNGVISKDGSKFAGISVNVDTSIWVYDFISQQWARFFLYNPTQTQGINAGGVLYADALEWDYTGEFLIYDAFNDITNTNGQDLEYWDVGFINVWDNKADTWGDGEVTKLFTQLEPGENIGNPAFSKNSPYIVGFDFFNGAANEYYVLGANIETGDVGTVFQQSILGYPSYSRLDNKVVFSAEDPNGDPIVGVVDMDADKINSVAGSAASLISDAQWPVWLTQGERAFNVSVEDLLITNEHFVVYPNPFNHELNVKYELEETSPVTISLYNMMGQKVKMIADLKNQPKGVYDAHASMDELPSGSYLVRLQLGDRNKTLKVVKY